MNATSKYLAAKLTEACAKEFYAEIDPKILGGLTRYAVHHIGTGSFLRAVLSNDLREAVGRADPENLLMLPKLVTFIYMELPAVSWGSSEKVAAWLAAPEQEDDASEDGGFEDRDELRNAVKGDLP